MSDSEVMANARRWIETFAEPERYGKVTPEHYASAKRFVREILWPHEVRAKLRETNATRN